MPFHPPRQNTATEKVAGRKTDQPCFLVVGVVITGMTNYHGDPSYNRVLVQTSSNLQEAIFQNGDGMLEDVVGSDFRGSHLVPQRPGLYILRGLVDELPPDDEDSDYPTPSWETVGHEESEGYKWMRLSDEQALKLARGEVLS